MGTRRSVKAKVVESLVEAALDQPRPTNELRDALQDLLTWRVHPDRDRSRDPVGVK